MSLPQRLSFVLSLVAIATASLLSTPAESHDRRPYVGKRTPNAVKQDGVTPISQSDFQPGHIDFSRILVSPNRNDPGDLSPFQRMWDARAAAVLRTAGERALEVTPQQLLHFNDYDQAIESNPEATGRILALMAHLDYFPESPKETKDAIYEVVNAALLQAKPGWAGTLGPTMDDWTDLLGMIEGNYDMAAMHLIPLAYRYFDHLSPEAGEHLVNVLLALGKVQRINLDDTFLSGPTPNDWRRAGWTSPLAPGLHHTVVGETENHILMILTARYLTNQLIYQRNPEPAFDNRRNDQLGGPPTTDLVLSLMRDILRGDFSEYNGKPYQKETRFALLNLASYAYDPEVRIAARMVLDYVSARIATSSNDIRRLVPFRRRNEEGNVGRGVGLIDWQRGADPLVPFFLLQTGNTRALALERPFGWPPGGRSAPQAPAWMLVNDGEEPAVEVVSDYRLPPAVHDLFVNDLHRRFYQRLHRTEHPDEVAEGRNCDHYEINASSPSYLITAGGKPCTYAVSPYFTPTALAPGLSVPLGEASKQIGVAVPTSFMPTGISAGVGVTDGGGLIQFGQFSDEFDEGEGVENYGVAPDLAFGYGVYLPPWVTDATEEVNGFIFVDKKPRGIVLRNRPQDDPATQPGFFLAIYLRGEFGLLEAFDTLLHPEVTFDQFKAAVLRNNPNFRLENNQEQLYITYRGHRVRLVIWNEEADRDEARFGAKVLHIDYAGEARCEVPQDVGCDRLGDAGNQTSEFLNGAILNSSAEALITIHNPYLKQTLVLDLRNKWNPIRTSETGEVETKQHEVWVDFDHQGVEEGNFYRPFKTLEAAAAAVADGGVIKLVPGTMRGKQTIRTGKYIRLVTPARFTIGAPYTPQ